MLGSGYKDKQDKVPFGLVRKSDDEKDIFKIIIIIIDSAMKEYEKSTTTENNRHVF